MVHELVFIESSLLLLLVLANLVISFHYYNKILDQLKDNHSSLANKISGDRSDSILDTHKKIDELLADWNKESDQQHNDLPEGTYCSITDQYKDSILFKNDKSDENM